MTRVPAGTAGVERHAEDGAVGIQVFDDYPALVERRRIRPRHLSLRHRRHHRRGPAGLRHHPRRRGARFTAAIDEPRATDGWFGGGVLDLGDRR